MDKTCVRCGISKPEESFPLVKPSVPFIRQKECEECFGNFKYCSGCDSTLEIDRFALKKSGCRESKCKTCRNRRRNRNPEKYRKKKIRNRELAVEYKGGKCSNPDCPVRHLDLPPCVFDFHHRDPNEKEFGICEGVNKGFSLSRLKKELDKCDILCCLCHRILHND